ncbi:MAG: RagB/SusD family nutrient uptake outer membrane protein [Prevotellaceae bacterium]|jgi:hypothetical protein|nr:RagB/SusD family nutrient uptake outer membrane protein [Prevotellaceae bacterium]
MKKKLYILLSLLAVTGFSCNDFLDEMPDNRAELDSFEKIRKLLVSAYPSHGYMMVTELSADNGDDHADNTNTDQFYDQVFYWQDVTAGHNETPAQIWSGCYGAIACANQALAAIEELGNSPEMQPLRGEALVCRAYAHFVLANVFCQHYSPAHAGSDLGIPYMEKPETELAPKYDRPSLASNYEKIAADLEAGLPLIEDKTYDIPKYHFNKKAAHTFASRFYLYYQQWDKVIEHSTAALGMSPQLLLRDYVYLNSLPKNLNDVSKKYSGSEVKANFLLLTDYSIAGYALNGAYSNAARYAHGRMLSQKETIEATGPWGAYSYDTYYLPPYVLVSANMDKVALPRTPEYFEFTDPVAATGYYRTVYVPFTAEEALLNRAEAYIIKEDYAAATADIQLWANNTIKTGANLITETRIASWANDFDYYTPDRPTPKKQINPDFQITEGKQENFIQCLLFIRRIETMHMGLRWFDLKRYGIEVTRRVLNNGGSLLLETRTTLTKRHNRYAIQIPLDVRSAGITPNPR